MRQPPKKHWSKWQSVKGEKIMKPKQIKLTSLTAIAIAILFNFIVITKVVTANSVTYMLFDVEMSNPAEFDRNLMESMQALDQTAGNSVETGVVTFHMPDGNHIQTVMGIEDVRNVLSGKMRYSDFIGNCVTVL